MFRALLMVVTSLALLVVLGAATNKIGAPHRSRDVEHLAAKDQPLLPLCHTASCRAAFSPESLKAGFVDPAMALRFQFADRVLANQ